MRFTALEIMWVTEKISQATKFSLLTNSHTLTKMA